MTRIFGFVLALILAGCGTDQATDPAPVQPTTFEHFSEEGGRVRDLADIIDPAFEAELTAMLDAAEADFGYQMAVVTTPSLHGYSIEEFSFEYANAWGLGHRDRNDGLLVMLAPNDRKVRIEVGAGIEESFSNAFAQDVIDEAFLPAFREAEYERGLRDGADMMVERMRAYPTVPANNNSDEVLEDAA